MAHDDDQRAPPPTSLPVPRLPRDSVAPGTTQSLPLPSFGRPMPRRVLLGPTGGLRATRRYKLAFSILVLAFLSAPIVVSLLNVARGAGSAREERRAPTPRLGAGLDGLKRFVGQAKWYFSERYGLKTTLISAHGLLKVRLLRTSSSSAVVLGQDDWLFLASENLPDYHRGANPLSETELRDWVSTLENRRRWLVERGVGHAFVIAPNPQTIYPEFLPDDVAKRGRTRLDQLNQALREHAPEVRLIDLAPALLPHKHRARLFFKTDTHWTPAGAFLGAKAIAARLGLPEPRGELLPARSRPIGGGDMARLLGLAQWTQDQEVWPAATPLPLRDENGRELGLGFTDVITKERLVVDNPEATGTALVYRDSFGEALVPWLSGMFKKTIWIASYRFSEDAVLKEKPDIVIEQIVERKLSALIRPGGGVRD